MFFKKTEEQETPAAEETAPAGETQQIDGETRKRIIAEYLASVRDTRPKEIMPEGGEMPAAPLKKPKTLGEAAVCAREIFNRKKGE